MNELRQAARLVLLDAERRVLLFRYIDADGRSFWATPGGGLECGETVEQAAQREAFEELGMNHVKLRELWIGHAEFRIGHRMVNQTETFLLLECEPFSLSREVEQAHEHDGIKEVRWWSLEDIEKAATLIFPTELVTRLRETELPV